MKEVFKKYGFFIFVAIACVQLIAVQFNFASLRFITKPLLMPVLALIVYYNSRYAKRSFILAALFFSFLGDSFLLLEDKYSLFFIFGLVSFLITHILYIIFFLGIKQNQSSILKKHPYIPLLILLYGTGLVALLYPSLGTLKIPVMFYAAIICLMLVCSFYIYKSVPRGAGEQFIMGALLFVISDSLLALNKFYQPLPFAGLLIMSTYCAAQYLIVRGFLRYEAQHA